MLQGKELVNSALLIPTKSFGSKWRQVYLETGVHPAIEEANKEARERGYGLPPLPLFDPSHDFVFVEFKHGTQHLGRVVFELFPNVLPVTTAFVKSRFQQGSSDQLMGTAVSKLIKGYGVFFGKQETRQTGVRSRGGSAVKLPRTDDLRHVERGLLSIAVDGSDVAICFDRVLVMDQQYQVVGRVHLGTDVVRQLEEVPINVDQLPKDPLVVSACGPTNSSGTYDAATDPAQRRAEDNQRAREGASTSIRQALAAAKRKPKEPANSSKAKRLKIGVSIADIDSDFTSDDEVGKQKQVNKEED